MWISSGRDHAEAVCAGLFTGLPLEFLWASERCTPRYDPESHELYTLEGLRKVRKKGASEDQASARET